MHWYDNATVADAVDEAKASGRPLLIDFWHPTCLGCAKLFAKTYADACVQSFLDAHVVAIKYNTTTPNEWYRKLNGHVAHFWHPHVMITDSRLTEGRRVVGFFEPTTFIAQIQLGIGMGDMHHRRFGDALTMFRAATAEGLPDNVVAEALYWCGVAAYRVTGLDALRVEWSALRARFPAIDWSQRADCLDVVIPARGFDPRDPSSVVLGIAE